jgi:general stress protein 26
MSYLEYHKEFENFITELKAIKIMVLATSAEDRVTARSVSVVAIKDCIYFQTDVTMVKARQIRMNQRVALCSGNLQIEGQAEIIGPWINNKEILEEYKKEHYNAYEKYKHWSTEVVIKIQPNKIKKWEYIDEKPYIYELDINKKTVRLKEYNI